MTGTTDLIGGGKKKELSAALHEDKDRVMLQIKLLVPPAQSAVDFIDLFCLVNYPGRAVKGSFQQRVTSHLHQLILIICPSHDSGQLLALSEKETDGSTWARRTGGGVGGLPVCHPITSTAAHSPSHPA